MMFRSIFCCLLLAVSCCALDLFSVKGRRSGVSSSLRNGRSSTGTTPKFVSTTASKTDSPDSESQGETILKDITEDANFSYNVTSFNFSLIQNVTSYDAEIAVSDDNKSFNQTETELFGTEFKENEAYETQVFLGDVLRQRITSNETGFSSNETNLQNTELVENGTAAQVTINQTALVNESNIRQEASNSSNIQKEASVDVSEQISTSEELVIAPKSVHKRSMRNLSPGEEFLLSVSNLEDTKSKDWRKLPYLMSLLQNGRLNVAKHSKTLTKRKDGVNRQSEWPMEMLEMMQNLEEEEDKSDDDDKSTSILAKWSADPMSLILSAIIPISVLIAAVLPILSDQFTTGMYIPSVATTATGSRSVRNLEEETNTTEFFSPLLESIVSLGAKAFEDITEESYDETKTRFLKQTFEMMTSFVNDRWKSLRNRFSKQKISCDGKNCTAPVVHQ